MDQNAVYWQMDDTGQLVNPAKNEIALQQIQPVLTALVTGIAGEIGADLHSMYVSGSTIFQSGTDDNHNVFIEMITDEFVDPELVFQDWIEPLQDRVLAEFSDLVDFVQLELLPYYYVIRDPAEFSPAAFWLHAESICLWGADIRPELPVYDFRRSVIRVAVANQMLLGFGYELQVVKLAIQSPDAQTDPDVITMLKHICIALAYHLTFPDNMRYTHDTVTQLQDIKRFFPEYAEMVDKLMMTDDALSRRQFDSIVKFLETELLPRCEAWLDLHNPERDDFFLIDPDV